MKKLALHILIIIVTFLSFNTSAQSKKVKGYHIEGDEIVFRFDKTDYEKSSDLESFFGFNKNDFQDLNIQSVSVAGDFNNWSMDQWKMKRINDEVYELRKKINDFSDNFTWEFKFVVNESYWAEPSKKDLNIAKANKNGMPLYVYNLKLFTSIVDKNGNAHFKLNGYPNAEKVILAGTFNKWDENVFKMSKTNDGWELTLELKPGNYEYKFIIDGEWIDDPLNRASRLNEHNTLNSIIKISKDVTFNLPNFKNAKKVILCGSFNNWNKEELKMSKTDKGWTFKLNLDSGKHHYKYIVDGKWQTDPMNSVKEFDSEGNTNSVIMIK